MASQHFIAFADRITGLGHIDAAPYGCSKLQNRTCQYNCACTGDAAVAQMLAYTKASAKAGRIAGLDHVAGGAKVWVMSGENDTIVSPQVGKAAADLYMRLGADVNFHVVDGAEHAFITDNNSSGVCNSCGYLGAPFIDDCGFDMAGAILTHLLGHLQPRKPFVKGHVQKLVQSDYFPTPASGGNNKSHYTHKEMGMSDTAYVYVPARCGSGPKATTESRQACRIHVVYHGCDSSADTSAVGMAIVENAGYNEHAEGNDLVVLYPQAHSTDCWNWDGEFPAPLTSKYDTRASLQIGVVNDMVGDLASALARRRMRRKGDKRRGGDGDTAAASHRSSSAAEFAKSS